MMIALQLFAVAVGVFLTALAMKLKRRGLETGFPVAILAAMTVVAFIPPAVAMLDLHQPWWLRAGIVVVDVALAAVLWWRRRDVIRRGLRGWR